MYRMRGVGCLTFLGNFGQVLNAGICGHFLFSPVLYRHISTSDRGCKVDAAAKGLAKTWKILAWGTKPRFKRLRFT